MKNYKDTDFAANKYADGIVYLFANETVEYTLEDYLLENPGKTKADYVELKALSDGIYEEQARDDNRQTYRNVSIHGFEETDAVATLSLDNILFDLPEQAAIRVQRRQLAVQAMDKLTEVQRRRYRMYHSNGLTMRQIAVKEGVVHSKIQNSLDAAEKKINKYIAGVKKMGVQNA